MTNPDAHVTLGIVHDHEGEPLTLRRDYDSLVVPEMTLKPAGVRELERNLVDWWNALARYRLRELDFEALGIDLGEARDDLAGIPNRDGAEEPRNLELADWVEVASRLEAMRQYGGYQELRKLSALLMADEAPACNCVISGGEFLPPQCAVHGFPCEECGGVESCAPNCGETPAEAMSS